MSNIFQKIETDIEEVVKDAENWLGEEFAELKGVIAPAAVSAVEAIEQAEASGILGAVATALSPVTKGLSVAANNAIEAGLPVALAIGLGIEGLPAAPQASDIAAFEDRVVAAVDANAGVNGTWQTNVAAQIYGLIQSAIAANAGTALQGTLSFAQIVVLVEQSFQKVVAAKAAATAAAAQPVAESNS